MDVELTHLNYLLRSIDNIKVIKSFKNSFSDIPPILTGFLSQVFPFYSQIFGSKSWKATEKL
jgi:hypothetical protein